MRVVQSRLYKIVRRFFVYSSYSDVDNFNNFFISLFIGRAFFTDNKTLGTFLIDPITMEISFSIPFIVSSYGNERIVRLILFDLGSSLLVFSFVYFIACRCGNNTKNSNKKIMKKVFLSPPT